VVITALEADVFIAELLPTHGVEAIMITAVLDADTHVKHHVEAVNVRHLNAELL